MLVNLTQYNSYRLSYQLYEYLKIMKNCAQYWLSDILYVITPSKKTFYKINEI